MAENQNTPYMNWSHPDLAGTSQLFQQKCDLYFAVRAINPKSLNDLSGIIINDVADHFETFHIVSKCKQTHVQTYSQIRQMKSDNISKFNNILANADYTRLILLADCPHYAYHSFMEIYTNAFNRACPVNSIKTPKNI